MDFKIVDNSRQVLNDLESKKQQILEAWGLTAEGYAKLTCPVDTGRLRNSISHDRDGSSMYVGTNVEYAPYVEYGHGSYAGAHYLRDSVQNHASEYESIAREYLQQ